MRCLTLRRTIIQASTLVLLGLALSRVQTARAIDLPSDARALVPASAVLVAAGTSLDDVDRVWAKLDGAEAGPDGPEDDEPSVREMITRFAPDVAPYVRGDQPLAVALVLDVGGGPRPYAVTLVLPVKPEVLNPPFLRTITGTLTSRVRGGYLGLSMEPGYANQATGNALIDHLAAGVVAVSVDMQTILSTLQPFVEMGLSAMEQQAQAPADSTGSSQSRMTPEQIAATQTMIRELMAGMQRLDANVDDQAAIPRCAVTLAGKPGSIFDLGPQPDFQQAVALGRFLPADLPLAEIGCVDATTVIGRFQPMIDSMCESAAATMPDAVREGYTQWLKQSTQFTDLWSRPFACAFDLGPDGLRIAGVVAMDDAPTQLERILAFYEGIDAAGMGLALEALPARDMAGVHVRGYRVVVDKERLAAAVAEGDGKDAEKAFETMARLYPAIWAAALPGSIVYCADPDPGAMGDLLQAVQRNQGVPRRDLASAVDNAAPHTQALVVGDLRRFLHHAFAWTAKIEAGPHAALPEIQAGNPVPFVAAYTVAGAEAGMTIDVDLDALHELIYSFEKAKQESQTDDRDAH